MHILCITGCVMHNTCTYTVPYIYYACTYMHVLMMMVLEFEPSDSLLLACMLLTAYVVVYEKKVNICRVRWKCTCLVESEHDRSLDEMIRLGLESLTKSL